MYPHHCSAQLACGRMCLWNTSDTHIRVAKWPHRLEFWESVSKRPLMCFHLLWLKQNWELKQRNKGGGKTEKREERQLSAKIKIRSRENNPVITTFCYRLCAFILDEEIHKQRLPDKKKNEVMWSRRRPFLDRKWFPAVGLHSRNTRLTLHHPSLHGPLTCSNSSFPQLQ